jgi:lipopolysaccharide exporter
LSDSQNERTAFDRELNRRIVRSSAWVAIGFGGARILSFASTLVLVRLLEPEAFGVVAIGMTLLAVISQVQESGLGAALVHGRRHDPRTAASSVLVFAAIAGFALTAVVVALAPLYTWLLRVPEATSYVQLLAVLLAVRGLGVVPGAILERDLDFRSRTAAELSGAVVQVTAAVACATAGLGAWSLVVGVIGGTTTQTAVMWLRAPWRPSPFGASRSVLREMLRYGRFVSGANVLTVVNINIDNAMVARFLGAGPLGIYNVAWRVTELPNTVIALIVGRVMFSVYSRLQHDLEAVRAAYVQNLQRQMLVALPVTVTLGLAAEPVVDGLLGPGWEGAVAPLQLLAVFGFVRLLTASGELFKGVGKPHLALLTSIVFLAAAAPALLVLVPSRGPSGAALAMVIAVTLSGGMSLWLTHVVLSLGPLDLPRALARPTACALLVAATVLLTLPAADSVSAPAALAVVAAAATASSVVAWVLLARPLLTPIWTALRRT